MGEDGKQTEVRVGLYMRNFNPEFTLTDAEVMAVFECQLCSVF